MVFKRPCVTSRCCPDTVGEAPLGAFPSCDGKCRIIPAGDGLLHPSFYAKLT